MPKDEDYYRRFLEQAQDGLPRADYIERVQNNVLKDYQEGLQYDSTYVDGIINNLISYGFLDKEKAEKTVVISIPEHTRNYIDGQLDDGFSGLVTNSLFYAFSREGVDQYAIDVILDVLGRIPDYSDAGISFNDLKESLDREQDHLNGYFFHDRNLRTLRELIKLLTFMELIVTKKKARYNRTPDLNKYTSMINRLHNTSIRHISEHSVRILGAKHPAITKRFLESIAKYHVYWHTCGVGKQRRLLRDLNKQMQKVNGKLVKDYYKKNINRYTGANVKRGTTLLHTSNNYRTRLRYYLCEKLNIGREKTLYDELKGIEVVSLERFCEECDTVEELALAVKASSSRRFDRNILNNLKHDNGAFSLPQDFKPYHWQQKAVDIWLKGSPGRDIKPMTGIVSAVTASGKTIMALMAISEYLSRYPDSRVSIIVPTKVLMYQWATELSKMLGLGSDEIGLRGDFFQDSFSAGKLVIVSIVNSAVKDERLKKDIETFGAKIHHLLVADECHRYGGEKYRKVFECRTTAKLGLSATPPSDEKDEQQMDSQLSPVVSALGGQFYKMSYSDARRDKLICEFTVKYVGVDLIPRERLEYDKFTKAIRKAIEKIQMRYGHRLDSLDVMSLDEKLNIILKTEDHPDPAIFRYFENTRERRDCIYNAVNRKTLYNYLLKNGLEANKKIMIFHERIQQMEDVISPLQRSRVLKAAMGDYEYGVDLMLDSWFTKQKFKPVMYHSKQQPYWNQWAMEWYRDDTANVMLSVKALVEGIDVPAAELGIVRVSSSSIRQRIQTIGRILRKGGHEKKAEIFVFFVKDTVDENMFRAYDWQNELGQSSIELYHWHPALDDGTAEELELMPIEMLPVKEEFVDNRPPIDFDVTGLEVGDDYGGRLVGTQYGVGADGRPFKRSKFGRIYLTNDTLQKAAQHLMGLKGGGKLFHTQKGDLITRTKDRTIFLGTVDPDILSAEFEQELVRTKEKRSRKKISFEDLFTN